MQRQIAEKELFQIIDVLKEEHREILLQIKNIENSELVDEGMLRKLFEFLDIHHEKEEQTLFPTLTQLKCLSQGGPLCGYFMGLRLDFDQLGLIRTHVKKFCERAGVQFAAKETPSWLSPQNYLSIPMEEHEVAHLLSVSLLKIIELKDTKLKEDFFKLLLTDYLSLLKLHVQKEDSCLFFRCIKNEI